MRAQTISNIDHEAVARSISQLRRATVREFVFNILRTFGDFDFSLPQLGTLLLLEEEGGEPTIKQVAEILGRSISTTSRLLDQLVKCGLVSRREDAHDRRAKRIAITEQGRELITTLERQRAETQIAVMEYLSVEEQANVAQALALLAEASKRRKKHEYLEPPTTEP
ncbi:MAG: MarR family winged helix-turn-helix transcriptional regulator [Ktedonobacteraceae bacterium]